MINLKDKFNKFDSISHNFDGGIVTAYNNLLKYDYEIGNDYVLIRQLRKDTLLLFNPDINFIQFKKDKPLSILCESPFEGYKIKVSETEYDLEDLFSNPEKQIRRGISINKRKELDFIESNSSKLYDIIDIFKAWKLYKTNDKKVFQMSFNPNRYLRTYSLKSYGFNIYEKIVYSKSKPYAVINFSLKDNKAFELSFVSKFFDKELKFINDLNECIIINCFYDLYKNYKIKKVNVGTDAGIKGLRLFKNKFKHQSNIIYSLTIK